MEVLRHSLLETLEGDRAQLENCSLSMVCNRAVDDDDHDDDADAGRDECKQC